MNLVLFFIGVLVLGFSYVLVAYCAWKLGRESKWEEHMDIQPSTVAHIIDPLTPENTVKERDQKVPLMQD